MAVAGRRVELLWAALYALVLVAGVAIGVAVMVAGYSPVPFADFWTQFDFIERALRGDVGIADFWAQHNEHRIAVARLQFLLDYGLFDGTNVTLFALIALSLFALAVVFAAAVQLDTREWLLTLGTLAVGAVSTMSAAGWENLTWAFQSQFVQVFLFATLAILLVAAAAQSPSGRRGWWLVALGATAAIAATYSMANGLFVWPVVVALGLVLPLGRRPTAALAVVGALTIASYLWHLEFTTRGELSDPVGLVTFVAVYLGSAVWGAGLRPAALVGGVGLVLMAALLALAWRRRGRRSVALPFGAGVATFVLLTAAQTAAGRLYLGTSQALSSRYSIASFTFWLALLVGFFVVVRERYLERPNVARAFLAAAAVATLFVSVRTIPDGDYLRTIRFGREATVLAYRAGVRDDSGEVTGVATGDTLVSALRWMESERLGPWAAGGMVDGMEVQGRDAHTPLACEGSVETVEPVKLGYRLRGWIAAPNAEPASRNLVVLDENGGRVGLGLVGAPRSDAAGTTSWDGFVAYLSSTPEGRLSVLLVGEDWRSRVCRLVAPPS